MTNSIPESPFTNKQLEVVRHYNTHRPIINICEGAVRSGKTQINTFLAFFNWYERAGENLDFIITGYSIGSIDRNVLKPLSDIFGVDTRLDKNNRFRLYGNNIHCFGTDKADSYKTMTGLTAAGWYGNEVTLSHQNSISEAFNRCSTDNFWILWDTNPDHPNHPIKKNYIDKSGTRLDSGRVWLKSWHFEIEDNTFLSQEYIQSLKLSIGDGVWYDRKIRGRWVVAEGAIYPGWNADIHVCDDFEIPDDWRRFRSIDLGYNNPFVCLWGALSPDDVLYVYDEHCQAKELISHHAKQIKKRPGKFEWTVRDHDAQDGAELEENGILTDPANKSVSHGIQLVANRLVKSGNGKPRLKIFRRCKNTISEIGSYRWKQSKDGASEKEEPVKIDDHCMDALRYMVMEIDFGGSQIWV